MELMVQQVDAHVCCIVPFLVFPHLLCFRCKCITNNTMSSSWEVDNKKVRNTAVKVFRGSEAGFRQQEKSETFNLSLTAFDFFFFFKKTTFYSKWKQEVIFSLRPSFTGLNPFHLNCKHFDLQSAFTGGMKDSGGCTELKRDVWSL